MLRSWVAPTPRLAAASALVAPVWLLSASGAGTAVAVGVTAALLLAVVVEAVTLIPASGLDITRETPMRSGLRDPLELRYTIDSRWPRTLQVALYQRLPAALKPRHSGALDVTTAGPHTVAVAEVTPLQRGVHTVGDVAVRVRGKWGLLARGFVVRLEDTVSVAPSLAPVRRFRLRALQARTAQIGPRVLRHRGESLTFSGLRQYSPGDDPRRIDWKATARQRVPITREYNLEQGQTVLIALDAGRLMTQTEDGSSRFERALSAAVVLATVAADAGDKVGLLVFDDSVRLFLPPRAGIGAVRTIRDALVGVEPTLVEPDYAAAFATVAARQRRRALIVVFSDVIDTRSSRALIAHTTRGSSRHLHVVVAMRSDALFTAGRLTEAPTTDSLYVSAAAEELVLAREEALQRMRRSGVTVVDVPAREVSAGVVDRYLEIKGRGAL